MRASSRMVDLSLENNNVPVKDLSAQEKLRLEQLEKVVVENFRTFVQVGQALAEIRERKLYRMKGKTFERYCRELFDIAERRVYELIGAAGVIENLRNCAVIDEYENKQRFLPFNEAQTRPMTSLNAEQQVVVWKAALDSAPKGKMTASHVKKVVKSFLGEKIKKTVHKARENVSRTCSAEFSELFEAFSEQIVKERKANYKYTSRGEIVKALDQLRAEIAEDGEMIEDHVLHGQSDDASKLQRAGFSLFRPDRSSMNIKQRNDQGSWVKYSGPYGTQKEMEAAFRAILQDDMHLRG